MNGPATGTLLPAGLPRLVGIVNITEDSFSDGGRYLAPRDALAHARRLRAEGADIVELGAAASHPDSKPVTTAEEQRRLVPVLEQLVFEGIPVSVDTFHPDTQRFAIDRGAAYLNDIQGFPHRGMYEELAAADCHLVVMHSVQRAGPATRTVSHPAEVWAGIDRFFATRLAALRDAGVRGDRLIVDPGLGYFLGSNPEPSLTALAGLRELKARAGAAVLVCPSRKSFLRALTGTDIAHSGPATLAAELFAMWQGVDYIRTHDVAALRDGLTVLDAIRSQSGPFRAYPGKPLAGVAG